MDVTVRFSPNGMVTFKRILVPVDYPSVDDQPRIRRDLSVEERTRIRNGCHSEYPSAEDRLRQQSVTCVKDPRDFERTSCDCCGKVYVGRFSKVRLSRHKQKCGKSNQTQEIAENGEPNSDERVCVHCNETFKDKEEFDEHLDLLLETDQPCPLGCGRIIVKEKYAKKYVHRQAYIRHIKECRKPKFEKRRQCPKCEREFFSSNYKTSLSFNKSFHAHKKLCKGPKQPSECPRCLKDYGFPSRLRRHLENSACVREEYSDEPAEEEASCRGCQRTFRSASRLARHHCKGGVLMMTNGESEDEEMVGKVDRFGLDEEEHEKEQLEVELDPEMIGQKETGGGGEEI